MQMCVHHILQLISFVMAAQISVSDTTSFWTIDPLICNLISGQTRVRLED